MIDPGKMRHRITFKSFSGARDSLGDPLWTDDEEWEDYAVRWASIDPISGREFYEARERQTDVTHKIRCRYLAGVRTDMLIFYRGRRFRILSAIDWEERHESLLIMAKELVS